ncbi:MAG: IPT/TIG domain-containing protein [Methanoregula sp.]|uniref:IPT/TIG domain-containing protein n=1 Tax=Methanoregula sp. TaxID=2052170 RepID=UPI003BB0107D
MVKSIGLFSTRILSIIHIPRSTSLDKKEASHRVLAEYDGETHRKRKRYVLVLVGLLMIIALVMVMPVSASVWTQVSGSSGVPFAGIPEGTLISGGTLYAWTDGDGVWAWNDTSWSQVGGSSGLTGYSRVVQGMISSGGMLYAATDNGVWVWDGRTWSLVGSSQPFYSNNGGLNIPGPLVSSGGTLYVVYGDDLWSWNSTMWSQVGTFPQTTPVVSFVIYNGAFYFGSWQSVWTRHGTSWIQVGDSVGDGWVYNLVSSGGTLYGGTENGVWAWNGTTWTEVGGYSGLTGNAAFIMSLISSGGSLYAGTDGGGVWTWNGVSWSQMAGPSGMTSGIIFSLLSSGSTLYAGTYNGVWATTLTPLSPPVITGISPSNGPASGGTSVTITGSGLSGATGVSFGSIPATSFTVVSDTQINATSPAGSAGMVHVTVTTPGGTSATSSADEFTYFYPAPVVTNISPDNGPVAGGTSVTVSGSGFTGATGVLFGSIPATGFTINSDSHITATSPAGSGIVDVIVTSPGGTSTVSSGDQFTYTTNIVNLITTTGILITLSSSPGTTLSNVEAIANPSPSNTPANITWPLGFISFDVNNVPVGGSATVTITMPVGTIVNTYYKYGPTPDDATPHWYPFMYDGQSGAQIKGNVITLHFVDGKRGDNDIAANGVISDAGGPGYNANIPLVPEFPSLVLPVTMIIGILGTALFLRRTREN